MFANYYIISDKHEKQVICINRYSTRHTFWYNLMLIPSIPLLADTYACLSWCWLFWCAYPDADYPDADPDWK